MSDKKLFKFKVDEDKFEEIESRGYKRAVKSFQNKFNKLKEVWVSWDKQPYGEPKLQKLPLGRKKRISKW